MRHPNVLKAIGYFQADDPAEQHAAADKVQQHAAPPAETTSRSSSYSPWAGLQLQAVGLRQRSGKGPWSSGSSVPQDSKDMHAVIGSDESEDNFFWPLEEARGARQEEGPLLGPVVLGRRLGLTAAGVVHMKGWAATPAALRGVGMHKGGIVVRDGEAPRLAHTWMCGWSRSIVGWGPCIKLSWTASWTPREASYQTW